MNHRGKVQLINATDLWTSIKNEGNKRRILSDDQRRQIVEVYAAAEDGAISRMLDYRRFGYRRLRVLRPLRMSLHVLWKSKPGPSSRRNVRPRGRTL